MKSELVLLYLEWLLCWFYLYIFSYRTSTKLYRHAWILYHHRSRNKKWIEMIQISRFLCKTVINTKMHCRYSNYQLNCSSESGRQECDCLILVHEWIWQALKHLSGLFGTLQRTYSISAITGSWYHLLTSSKVTSVWVKYLGFLYINSKLSISQQLKDKHYHTVLEWVCNIC